MILEFCYFVTTHTKSSDAHNKNHSDPMNRALLCLRCCLKDQMQSGDSKMMKEEIIKC